MNKQLHIVSFNVPYPADYGGVIDVFYRLKALAALGVDIHLHAFTYGREPAPQLEQFCKTVTYYRRKTGIVSALSTRPYIVASRDNSTLLHNLQRDNNPVLLEGLHCCALLEKLTDRPVFVRAHNVEHEYYRRLAQTETILFRKIYLLEEARRLRRYEPVLRRSAAVLAVTQADADHFRAIGVPKVLLMPSSHEDDDVVSKPGQGDFVLFHADLSVPDNIKSVQYLAENVFSKSDIQFVVAGRNPSASLKRLLSNCGNVRLVANPDNPTMHRLITDAHVQIMVTNQPTGLKLRLLNSLYSGRHCLVNSYMVAGTNLDKVCSVADTPEQQLAILKNLMAKPFTSDDIEIRRQLLGSLYSNAANARILANLL